MIYVLISFGYTLCFFCVFLFVLPLSCSFDAFSDFKVLILPAVPTLIPPTLDPGMPWMDSMVVRGN